MPANIIITGFRQGFEKDAGGALVPCDFVSYVPAHAPQSMANEEKVRRLDPEIALKKLPEGTEGGEKIAHMRSVWDVVKPAHEAWKEGREVPLNGTPLAAWPGLTPEMAEIFRLAGIRSVEQVRDMNDALRSKVRLPNTIELMQNARLFLENSGAAAAAERQAEMQRRLDEQDAIIKELVSRLPEKADAPEPEPEEVEPRKRKAA
jgi:hypothetical protein